MTTVVSRASVTGAGTPGVVFVHVNPPPPMWVPTTKPPICPPATATRGPYPMIVPDGPWVRLRAAQPDTSGSVDHWYWAGSSRSSDHQIPRSVATTTVERETRTSLTCPPGPMGPGIPAARRHVRSEAGERKSVSMRPSWVPQRISNLPIASSSLLRRLRYIDSTVGFVHSRLSGRPAPGDASQTPASSVPTRIRAPGSGTTALARPDMW